MKGRENYFLLWVHNFYLVILITMTCLVAQPASSWMQIFSSLQIRIRYIRYYYVSALIIFDTDGLHFTLNLQGHPSKSLPP